MSLPFETMPKAVVGTRNIRWGIVLFFMVLGPPIGGLTFILAGALSSIRSIGDVGIAAVNIASILGVVFLFFSYVFGTVPAAAAGLLVAAAEARCGTVSWLMAVAIGLLVGIGDAAVMALMSLGSIRPLAVTPSGLAASIVINGVPTLICWAMVRRLLPPVQPEADF